jgi:hypothetical protein
MTRTTRRQFLVLAAGALAASQARAQLPPNIAAQRKAALDEAVKKATGGAPVRPGRVNQEIPPRKHKRK